MIVPNQFYRKFKVVIEIFDEATKQTSTVRGTINLGDIANYNENERSTKEQPLLKVNFNINIPPIIIQMSYVDFDKIFDEYLRSINILDERSVKKKLTYNGPMQFFFYHDDTLISAVGYPKGYDFQNKPPDVVADNMLFNIITPMN